jgi:hypothetical protein
VVQAVEQVATEFAQVVLEHQAKAMLVVIQIQLSQMILVVAVVAQPQ